MNADNDTGQPTAGPDTGGNSPVRCERCGLEVPTADDLVRRRRSFSTRERRLCAPCRAELDYGVQAWSDRIGWGVAMVLLLVAVLGGDLREGFGLVFVGMMLGLSGGMLLHEIGHALAAVVMGFRVWRIEVGNGRRWWGFGIGRLRINLNGFLSSGYVVCEALGRRGRVIRMAVVVLAGPAVNGLAAGLIWWLGSSWTLLNAAAWVNVYLAVTNFIPCRPFILPQSGYNDGVLLWRLWRASRVGDERVAESWGWPVAVWELDQRGEWDEVLRRLDAVSDKGGDPTVWWAGRVSALIGVGRFRDAAEAGRTGLSETRASMARGGGEDGESEIATGQVQAANRALLANNTASAIVLSEGSAGYQEAVGLADEALAVDPDNAVYLGTRASVALAGGRWEQGRQWLHRSMSRDAGRFFWPLHYAWLGRLAERDGDAERAADLLAVARSGWPGRAEVEAVAAMPLPEGH